MSDAELLILPEENCRRSQKLLEYLDREAIPHRRIDLRSPEGEQLLEKHQFLASPGILFRGTRINPMEIMEPRSCRVDGKRLHSYLSGEDQHE